MSSDRPVNSYDLVVLALVEMSELEHERNHTATAVRFCVGGTCRANGLAKPSRADIDFELERLEVEGIIYWEPTIIKSEPKVYGPPVFKLLKPSDAFEMAVNVKKRIEKQSAERTSTFLGDIERVSLN